MLLPFEALIRPSIGWSPSAVRLSTRLLLRLASVFGSSARAAASGVALARSNVVVLGPNAGYRRRKPPQRTARRGAGAQAAAGAGAFAATWRPGRPWRRRRRVAINREAQSRRGGTSGELAAGERPEVRSAAGDQPDRDGDRAAGARSRRLRGAPRAALGAPADGRAVHLLRSDGAGGVPARPGHRRAAASAHRARHRDLPVRGRDHPSRQPRHAAADPTGRGQLDDRRARHRPFRAHRARGAHGRRQAVRHPDLGGAARACRGDRARLQPSRGGGAAADRRSRARACA